MEWIIRIVFMVVGIVIGVGGLIALAAITPDETNPYDAVMEWRRKRRDESEEKEVKTA